MSGKVGRRKQPEQRCRAAQCMWNSGKGLLPPPSMLKHATRQQPAQIGIHLLLTSDKSNNHPYPRQYPKEERMQKI